MSDLAWYVNRLRAMSAAEIAHRFGERVRRTVSRHRHRGWEGFAVEDRGVPRIAGLREAVADAPADVRDRIAGAAARLLDGHFHALGVDWPKRQLKDLFPTSAWRLDPVTGRLWPGADRYTFDIAYRHEQRLGDIKYVWEFNRLQFLQPLAAQAFLNDDTLALQAVEAAIASWHDANPPFFGLGWNSGIELALRAISLLVAGSLCGERFSPGSRQRLARMLAAHAFWLSRFPSRHSSANNHLVAEAAGLYLIGLSMPQDKAGAARTQRARATLLAEAQKQILADGAGAEQSPTYAAFTVELLLVAAFAADYAGQAFGQAFDERLARFVDFVSWLAEPDGSLPQIGDDDEGRVLGLCEPEPHYVASVATAAAARLGLAAPCSASPELRDAVFGPAAGTGEPPQGMKTFAEGGLSVVRGRLGKTAYTLILDHGPLGYLSIAAHGHADALALLLSLDGRPVLVDPGTYLYHSGGEWRDWFRSTPAHNTLAVADADQSTISGPFNWSHKAETRLDEARAGSDWRLAASHDGYEKRFGVRHERAIEPFRDGFVVTDRLTGGAPAQAAIAFQLAPGLSTYRYGATVRVSRDARALLTIEFPDASVTVTRGGQPGDCGWVSGSFGARQEADRLVWRGPVDAEGSQTVLRLHHG